MWEKAIQPRVTVGVRSWQMLLVSDQLLIAVQAQGNDCPSLSPEPAPWCWAGVRVK